MSQNPNLPTSSNAPPPLPPHTLAQLQFSPFAHAAPLTLPLAHNGATGGSALEDNALAAGDPGLETRMMALQAQQIFQRKQADLLMSYQQAQANLAIQHIKFTQQLSYLYQQADPTPPGPPSGPYEEMATFQKQGPLGLGSGHAQPPLNSGPGGLVSSSSLNHLPSGDMGGHGFGGESEGGGGAIRPLRRTYSSGATGSGTISQRTRQKLINVLQKKTQQKERVGGSPLFEPYPLNRGGGPRAVLDNIPRNPGGRVIGSDFELRKVSSEPNLKMKQRLRDKLLRNRHSPTIGPSAFHSPPPSHPAQKSAPISIHTGNTANGANSAYGEGCSFIFPSPSLPNLPSFPAMDLGAFPLLPSHNLNPNIFLSMPSLLSAGRIPPSLPLPTLPSTNPLSPDDGANVWQGASGGATLSPTSSQPSLLKQQLRDLVLRRKSLVREETEEEVRREVSVIQAQASYKPFSQQNTRNTGLAYDAAMSKHQCMCGQNKQHVEHGGRTQSIWARLLETGLTDRCVRITARKAPLEHLKLAHSETYVTFFGVSPTACLKLVENCRDPSQLPLQNFVRLPCGGYGIDSDTYFNDASTQTASRLAAGYVTELALQVLEGRLLNGFAVVRPPGHHAERDQAMGFCYFNNIAVAVKTVQQRAISGGRSPLKIAIIDWDVHHGNGTQLAFEKDSDVLYLSLHRHDNGNFFPGTGAVTDVGREAGKSFSVNVPWSGGCMGDAEYLAAWRVVVAPVLDQFKPEMIFVSAGFDAAKGHPAALGGYKLSPNIFGYMTRQLMNYASGRVVMALEGGYDLAAISDASELCVRALLTASDESGQSDMPILIENEAMNAPPQLIAQETLQKVVAIHKNYWRSLSAEGVSLSQAQWDAMNSRFASLSVKTQSEDSSSMSTS